jgi:hypothetical protein
LIRAAPDEVFGVCQAPGVRAGLMTAIRTAPRDSRGAVQRFWIEDVRPASPREAADIPLCCSDEPPLTCVASIAVRTFGDVMFIKVHIISIAAMAGACYRETIG